jgi:hypothetical protein
VQVFVPGTLGRTPPEHEAWNFGLRKRFIRRKRAAQRLINATSSDQFVPRLVDCQDLQLEEFLVAEPIGLPPRVVVRTISWLKGLRRMRVRYDRLSVIQDA